MCLLIYVICVTLISQPSLSYPTRNIEEKGSLNKGSTEWSYGTTGGAFIAIASCLCLVLVVLGCVCCGLNQVKWNLRRPQRLSRSNNWSAINNNDHEICIFPPPGAQQYLSSSMSNVYIEPLPDISSQLYGRHQTSSQLTEQWFAEPHKNFPRNQLQYVRSLGAGWFGQVLEGRAIGVDTDHTSTVITEGPSSKSTPVVVKTLREDASSQEQALFLQELIPYRDVSHQNILKIVAYCLETQPLLVLLEHCPKGDLKGVLKKDSSITDKMLLRMAENLSAGLEHMHKYNFIHTDLAARNCLVEDDFNVKIGDYGCSLELYKNEYYLAENVALPIRWCAPETLKCTDTIIETIELTKEANVWSFGIVLWEILSRGKLPYGALDEDAVIQKVILEKSHSLKIEETNYGLCSSELSEILGFCFSLGSGRPGMSQLHLMINALLESQSDSDFDIRWQQLDDNKKSMKVNSIIRDINEFGLESELGLQNHYSKSSPTLSLKNLHGSVEDLEAKITETFGSSYPSWMGLEPGQAMDSLTQEISEAIQKLDEALSDNVSESTTTTSSPIKNGVTFRVGGDSMVMNPPASLRHTYSDGEEENLTMRLEHGEFSELARIKSQSVHDFMTLTVVDDGSDSSDKASQPGSFVGESGTGYNGSVDKKNFSSESNLREAVRDAGFMVELEKLQAEHKFSIISEASREGMSSIEYSGQQLEDEMNSDCERRNSNPFLLNVNPPPFLMEGLTSTDNQKTTTDHSIPPTLNNFDDFVEISSPDCIVSSRSCLLSDPLPDIIANNIAWGPMSSSNSSVEDGNGLKGEIDLSSRHSLDETNCEISASESVIKPSVENQIPVDGNIDSNSEYVSNKLQSVGIFDYRPEGIVQGEEITIGALDNYSLDIYKPVKSLNDPVNSVALNNEHNNHLNVFTIKNDNIQNSTATNDSHISDNLNIIENSENTFSDKCLGNITSPVVSNVEFDTKILCTDEEIFIESRLKEIPSKTNSEAKICTTNNRINLENDFPLSQQRHDFCETTEELLGNNFAKERKNSVLKVGNEVILEDVFTENAENLSPDLCADIKNNKMTSEAFEERNEINFIYSSNAREIQSNELHVNGCLNSKSSEIQSKGFHVNESSNSKSSEIQSKEFHVNENFNSKSCELNHSYEQTTQENIDYKIKKDYNEDENIDPKIMTNDHNFQSMKLESPVITHPDYEVTCDQDKEAINQLSSYQFQEIGNGVFWEKQMVAWKEAAEQTRELLHEAVDPTDHQSSALEDSEGDLTTSKSLSSSIDLLDDTDDEGAYISYDTTDDEVMRFNLNDIEALRSELHLRLVGPKDNQIEEMQEETVAQDDNDIVFINYKSGFPGNLSPIQEEDTFPERDEKPHILSLELSNDISVEYDEYLNKTSPNENDPPTSQNELISSINDTKDILIIEDLESTEANSLTIGPIVPSQSSEDLLLVDTETNNVTLVDSGRPQSHIAFVVAEESKHSDPFTQPHPNSFDDDDVAFESLPYEDSSHHSSGFTTARETIETSIHGPSLYVEVEEGEEPYYHNYFTSGLTSLTYPMPSLEGKDNYMSEDHISLPYDVNLPLETSNNGVSINHLSETDDIMIGNESDAIVSDQSVNDAENLATLSVLQKLNNVGHAFNGEAKPSQSDFLDNKQDRKQDASIGPNSSIEYHSVPSEIESNESEIEEDIPASESPLKSGTETPTPLRTPSRLSNFVWRPEGAPDGRYTPDWETDSDGDVESSSTSGEFVWQPTDNHFPSVNDSNLIEPSNTKEETNSASSLSEDSESGEEEFTPSTWNRELAPHRSLLKSPESNSLEKKSVRWKRQRHHRVYEYPPEPRSWHPETQNSNTRRTWGGRSVDFLSMGDWDLNREEFWTEKPEDLEELYSHQPTLNTPQIYHLNSAVYNENSKGDVFCDNEDFFMGSSVSSYPFRQSSFTPADFFPNNSSTDTDNYEFILTDDKSSGDNHQTEDANDNKEESKTNLAGEKKIARENLRLDLPVISLADPQPQSVSDQSQV